MSWKEENLKSESVKTYVPSDKLQEWREEAKKMGFTRETEKGEKANISKFVKTMVESALNDFSPDELVPSDEVEKYRARIRNLKRENENLRKQNKELKKREIGVSEDRIISKLSSEEVTKFDDLVQELINTEGEATYKTLQRLMRKDVVEYVPSHNAYRLKEGNNGLGGES